MTGSAAYQVWLRAGQPDSGLALPLVQLRDVLRAAGYTVYDRPNAAHLQAQPPEDHTPFSATGWPKVSPLYWRHAIDVMPKSGDAAGARDLWLLGARIAGDRNAGLITWLKYINRPPAADLGRAIQDSWQPGHAQRSSSDTGHLHLSSVTGVETLSAPYNPLAAAAPTAALPSETDMLLVRPTGQPADTTDKTVWLWSGGSKVGVNGGQFDDLRAAGVPYSDGKMTWADFESLRSALIPTVNVNVTVNGDQLNAAILKALSSVKGSVSFS